MKTVNVSFLRLMATVTVLFICYLIANAGPGSINADIAYADPSGGGPTVLSVAKIIHNASTVEALAQELDQVLAAYAVEREEISRNDLWKKAQDILAELIKQANNVESEISIMSNKQLDKVYARKLDRVLSIVIQLRATYENKMQTAGKSG